jgi:hypothetical protein
VPSRTTPDDDSSDIETLKWCTHCGDQKPLSQFHRDANNADGHKNQCKDCRAEIHAEQGEGLDPRIAAIEEQALEALDRLASGGTVNPHTEDVIDSMMRFTGGIDGFIRRVNANYFASPPGSQQRTKIDLAFMALIAGQEKDKGALGKLSIAELQRLFVTAASQLQPVIVDATAHPVEAKR